MTERMLGVDLFDRRLVVVELDQTGRILGRSDADLSADFESALAAALQHATGTPRPTTKSSAPISAIGVAAHNPDSDECRAVVKALARRYGGQLAREGPMGPTPSGTAAAVGEAWIGAARDATEMVFFAVAEHAAAGIVRNGRPVVGAHSRAAAVGWLALNPVEREDYRKGGCLEAEVAASGIVRRLVWRIKAGDRSSVQDLIAGNLAAITVDHVLDGARRGDGVCISVLRDTAKYLGMAAANLVIVADPVVLVLGGIMATAGDLLLEQVRTEIARRVPPSSMQALTIVSATLGADAAAIGAARLAAVLP